MMTGEKSCAVVEGDGPMRFYPLLSLSLPLVPVLSLPLSLFLPLSLTITLPSPLAALPLRPPRETHRRRCRLTDGGAEASGNC